MDLGLLHGDMVMHEFLIGISASVGTLIGEELMAFAIPLIIVAFILRLIAAALQPKED